MAFFLKHFQSKDIDNFKKDGRNFHLTFDDGLREVYDVVLPYLLENQLHATIFINSDFVDNKKLFIRHKSSLIVSLIKKSQLEIDKVSSFLEIEKENVLETILKLNSEKTVDQIVKIIGLNFREF